MVKQMLCVYCPYSFGSHFCIPKAVLLEVHMYVWVYMCVCVCVCVCVCAYAGERPQPKHRASQNDRTIVPKTAFQHDRQGFDN